MDLRCFLGLHKHSRVVTYYGNLCEVTEGCLRCGRWWYKHLFLKVETWTPR